MRDSSAYLCSRFDVDHTRIADIGVAAAKVRFPPFPPQRSVIFLGRVLTARLVEDALQELLSGNLRSSGFRVPLRFMQAAMNQNPSVTRASYLSHGH